MAVLNEIELKYETLIEGIVGQGFGICDNFIPNDCFLDHMENMQVITGCNGSGKSVYIKQVSRYF